MQLSRYADSKIWAVIGSVHNKQKVAYEIYNFLKSKGYKVYPVDPEGTYVDGEKTYKSLLDLPEVPEVIDMVINPVRGEAYIDEAKKLNIKYIWFQPGAESKEIVERAQEYGINVVYNHCVLIEL